MASELSSAFTHKSPTEQLPPTISLIYYTADVILSKTAFIILTPLMFQYPSCGMVISDGKYSVAWVNTVHTRPVYAARVAQPNRRSKVGGVKSTCATCSKVPAIVSRIRSVTGLFSTDIE